MGFLTLGAQAAGLVTGLMGMGHAENAARTTAAMQAYGTRYEAAVTANQALTAAENAARTAEAKAEADIFNAKVAEQMSESEVDRATAEAGDFRRVQGARIASHRATQAASGVALEGSPLMVDEALFTEMEFGAQRIAYGGQLARTRGTNQARLLRRSADFETSSAKTIRKAGADTAKYALEAGEIGAKSAITAGDIKATAARLAGIGDAFRTLAAFGSTISTVGGNSWGGGSGGSSASAWAGGSGAAAP